MDISHAVYLVHLANTSIAAIFNQWYLSIPTLPNEQQHSRYKADAADIETLNDSNDMWSMWRDMLMQSLDKHAQLKS